MRFIPTPLAGAFVVEPEPYADERGLFARTFCAREFADNGLSGNVVQCSSSWSVLRGTVRGLHFQRHPSAETKLVRCTAGAIWDVIVDLRESSPTRLRHFAVKLAAGDRRALFIPAQFAHGFQTLDDHTEVFYQMGDYHAPDLAGGIRHDDPKLGIAWPLPVTTISDKDRAWPAL